MNGRWLLTGANGQLGSYVAEALRVSNLNVVSPTRGELDLSNPEQIRDLIRAMPLTGVINCAAYTAVDKAEGERDLAFAINAKAPEVFAYECATRKIPLVHVSTDYVFDGQKQTSYLEDDRVGPINVYGESKERGENAIRNSGVQHAIIRTAWLLGPSGANFLTTMLRLGKQREKLQVVADQTGCPTSHSDVANAIVCVAKGLEQKSGTWHFVNNGTANWFELANFIFDRAQFYGQSVPTIVPIATADYPTPARRPANSQLSTKKFEADFGIRPRKWENAVSDILAKIFD